MVQISVYGLIQIAYLGISIGSTYCVYVNDTYYDLCVQVIFAMCIVDYVVHFVRWSRMRTDMMIHHAFVMVFIGMLFAYNSSSRYGWLYQVQSNSHHPRNLLITTMVSTEISTMFLVMIPWIRPRASEAYTLFVSTVNKILFVTTFVYYRLYKYGMDILINTHMHRYIYDEITSVPSILCIQMCLYCTVELCIVGMWILNMYWFVLIVRKALRT